MIEFTTGVMLLTSIYVAGSTTAMIANTDISTSRHEVGYATTTHSQLTDSKHIQQYVREQYAKDPLLVEIARCESTYRQFDADGNIIRGKVNKADVGVMQINEKYHAERATKLGLNIYTLEGNVAYAKLLYKEQGSQPWISSSPCWGGSPLAQR